MKNIIRRLFLKYYSRPKIFRMIFNKDERTAIENALWRRSEDDTTKGDGPGLDYNEVIKYNCKKIAREFYE